MECDENIFISELSNTKGSKETTNTLVDWLHVQFNIFQLECRYIADNTEQRLSGDILSHHGLSGMLILDRNLKFVSEFW